ncbi:hypothetical protein, partial [Thiolapillus sp.]|uniref:hypothetical protein n=1 Tax=Thiolapillus sp. TaxID=2017437 RepID=UPI003AF92467
MFSLWRKARRENSAASRLLGSTSLRFALHGWQRMHKPGPEKHVSSLAGWALTRHVDLKADLQGQLCNDQEKTI